MRSNTTRDTFGSKTEASFVPPGGAKEMGLATPAWDTAYTFLGLVSSQICGRNRGRPSRRLIGFPIYGVSMPFDVCVIGSGPAGGVLSKELAEAGAKVALVEAG